MKKSFLPNNLETNTKIMASYLPPGELFSAKDIYNSNFNKLMRALAREFGRNQDVLFQLSEQHNISTTTDLLDEWERALGIPCECFDKSGSIDQRRLQCVAKFAKMNIATEADWINLAKFFGYNIRIEHGSKYYVLPFTLPFILGDLQTSKFTIIVVFIDLPPPINTLPLTLPFTLGGKPNLIECLFNSLKPVDCQVLYKYLG